MRKAQQPWFANWGVCVIASSLTSANLLNSLDNGCYFGKYFVPLPTALLTCSPQNGFSKHGVRNSRKCPGPRHLGTSRRYICPVKRVPTLCNRSRCRANTLPTKGQGAFKDQPHKKRKIPSFFRLTPNSSEMSEGREGTNEQEDFYKTLVLPSPQGLTSRV